MGQIKFQLPDSSPKGRKRLAAAKGFGTEDMIAGAVGESLRKYAPSGCSYLPITRNAQYAGGGANVAITSPMFFSPMHTPQNWQIAQKRKEVYQWARFYYENEPKVAAGVDFYAQFPMNGFELECQNRAVRLYFEHMVKDLKLAYWLKLVSHEYFLLGDVFPFLTIECEKCGGGGVTKSGKPCNHPDGKFKNITILNPDFIEVEDSPIPGPKAIYMIPDDNLKKLVQRKEPRKDFDRLPPMIAQLVAGGQPIPLSPRSVSHIKHSEVGYSRYGTSLLRRLFTILGYKTKLMTANWIVAERLVLPVRVVKLGEKERPAGPEDIADMQSQLASVANDPNLTIVTHHAFDYEWYGACHAAGTEILTLHGFKDFSTLGANESVAQYDPKTGNVSFKPYLERHEYDYAGELIRFKHRSMDVCVTPNHRMLVERASRMLTIEAKDVQHNDKFVSTASWEGIYPSGPLPYRPSPLEELSLANYLKLAGYYISEGGCKFERTRGLSAECELQSCGITQKTTSDFYEDVRGVCALAGSKSVAVDNRSNAPIHTFMFSAKTARYLSCEFGVDSSQKKIPSWIKNLPVEHLSVIFEAMMNGDGSRRDGKFRYNTTSKQLADDVAEIALKLGYFSKTSLETVNSENRANVYRVYFTQKRKNKKFTIRARNISRVPYDGKVYCVQSETGYIVTRYNGCVSIHGNSGKIHNIQGEWEQIGKEILDGLMLNQSLLNGEMQGYCHSEDTKTLTDSGFKYHWEIDPTNDKIACFNPGTKKIEYHLPHEKVVYDYSGEMVQFQTDKIDILVTPNHRMWSAKRDSEVYEFTKAEDVRQRAKFIGAVSGFVGEKPSDFVKYTAHGKTDVVLNMGNASFTIDDYCKFAGYFVSEGYTSSEPGRFGICQTSNGKAREDIACLMSRCFEKFSVSETAFYGTNHDLYQHLRSNFGKSSSEKCLSPFVKNMPVEQLEIVIHSMLMGDGCITKRHNRKQPEMSYYTSSQRLAEDFAEIAFKCGYVVKISDVGRKNRKKKYFNKKGVEFVTRLQQYAVHISKGFKGREPVLESKSERFAGKEITKKQYSGKIYCFSVPHELFVTMRNGKVTVQGNTSAQVGVETMIRRLENWRNTLSEWVEEHIFKPTAMMQGFIDEKATKQLGRTVYLYPTIKWNDMQLRDKTNKLQLLMQLHDKQIISTEKLCEEFDIDYDQEIERIRDESMAVGPGGAAPPGGDPGAGGGMPPAGGGGAPPPGADPSAMMPPGGGAPGMPGAGGMPGADGGMPGAGLAPNASGGDGLKVHKRGKAPKGKEAEPAPPPTMVKLTKIEQRIWKSLQGMKLPFPVYGQYKQKVHGQQQPYRMDFAIPSVGIDIECLHPDQPVQTNQGVKSAKDISAGEHLYGRNGDEVQVVNVFRNPASAETFKIKAMGCLPVSVTGNHPMLVSRPKKIRVKREEPSITRTREYCIPSEPEWLDAKNVNVGDYLMMPKPNLPNVNVIDTNIYNPKTAAWNSRYLPSLKMDFDFGRLLGLYIAEGSSTHGHIEFSFSSDETDLAAEVVKIIKAKFGVEAVSRKIEEDHVLKVSLCHTALSKLLQECGKYAPEKRIPSFAMISNPEFIEGLISGIRDGDGCVAGGRKDRIVSSSRGLLLDIQRLLASVGQFGRISESRALGTITVIQGRQYVTHGLWEIAFSEQCDIKLHYREDDGYFYLPVKSIEITEGSDFTVNFETRSHNPISDHTFVVSNLVTHNCDGKIWHEQEGAKEGDAERDRKLAAYGWRVLRFNEDAIMEQMDEVTKVIHQNISEAAQERFSKRKKASGGEGMTKYASLEYAADQVSYVKGGREFEWDGVNPTGIIQIVRGVTDDTIQLEVTASGGSEEDQGPGDQLERDLPGQIRVAQETL